MAFSRNSIARIKMYSFALVLISVAYLSPVLLALPETEGSIIDGPTLDLNEDSNRIFGGHEAARGQFPYHVSVREWFEHMWDHICGGSIISEGFILTSARCRTPLTAEVVVGAHSINEDDGDRYRVRRWIVHEKFHRNFTEGDATMRNDIALIEPIRRIKFNKFVGHIALQRKHIEGGVQAVTSGWGSPIVSFHLHRPRDHDFN